MQNKYLTCFLFRKTYFNFYVCATPQNKNVLLSRRRGNLPLKKLCSRSVLYIMRHTPAKNSKDNKFIADFYGLTARRYTQRVLFCLFWLYFHTSWCYSRWCKILLIFTGFCIRKTCLYMYIFITIPPNNCIYCSTLNWRFKWL